MNQVALKACLNFKYDLNVTNLTDGIFFIEYYDN